MVTLHLGAFQYPNALVPYVALLCLTVLAVLHCSMSADIKSLDACGMSYTAAICRVAYLTAPACQVRHIRHPVTCAGYVLKCLLSPDMRQLATISSDKTVKLWNVDGFTLDRTLTGGCCIIHQKLAR